MPDCGFGNKVLFYNNIRQLAYHYKCDWGFYHTPEFQIFKGHEHPIYADKVDIRTHHDVEIVNFCLGERFYGWNFTSPKNIFQVKDAFKPNWNPMQKTCAIHIRGKDFHQWNPKSILPVKYYIDSIDYLKSKYHVDKFILYTDDYSLNSVKSLTSIVDKISKTNSLFLDFAEMSEADYIISSPSTFAICAGFIGKQKKIIHNKEWVEDRANKNDGFWMCVASQEHKDYQIEAFI